MLRCVIKINTTHLNMPHMNVALYSETSADALSLRTQNHSMGWSTMSSSVICRSNEMGQSSMQLNDERDLSQCIPNYQKWLVMYSLFRLQMLMWKGNLVSLRES